MTPRLQRSNISFSQEARRQDLDFSPGLFFASLFVTGGVVLVAMDSSYWLVFLGSLVEGDATLLTAAFLSHRGPITLGGVLIAAATATTLGNEAVYHLSRNRSRRYFERKIGEHPKYRRVQNWIRSRSAILLLCSRYVFGFRWAIPAACGLTGMTPPVFSILNLIGAALWVLPLGFAGYLFGGYLDQFWSGFHQYEWHFALGVLALVWIAVAVYDPELHAIRKAVGHTRGFAIGEAARLRKLMKSPVLKRWYKAKQPPVLP